MDKSWTAAAELSSVRWTIDGLQRIQERLLAGGLDKESAEVLDLSVQLSKLYVHLVELASKPPVPSTRKHAKRSINHEDLPF